MTLANAAAGVVESVGQSLVMIDVFHDDAGPQAGRVFGGGSVVVDSRHGYGGMGGQVAHCCRFVPGLFLGKLYDSYHSMSECGGAGLAEAQQPPLHGILRAADEPSLYSRRW